jgi:hypothetical protein
LLCLGLAVGIFNFTKILCAFLLSSMHATCPAHLTLLDWIVLISGERYKVGAPHCEASCSLHLFNPLWLRIFSSAPCSQPQSLHSWFSLNVRDQVSRKQHYSFVYFNFYASRQ